MSETMRAQAMDSVSGGIIDDASHLAHEVAVLAGRLAQLLGEASIALDDPVAAGIRFLQSVAGSAGAGAWASAPEHLHPIERLWAGVGRRIRTRRRSNHVGWS